MFVLISAYHISCHIFYIFFVLWFICIISFIILQSLGFISGNYFYLASFFVLCGFMCQYDVFLIFIMFTISFIFDNFKVLFLAIVFIFVNFFVLCVCTYVRFCIIIVTSYMPVTCRTLFISCVAFKRQHY